MNVVYVLVRHILTAPSDPKYADEVLTSSSAYVYGVFSTREVAIKVLREVVKHHRENEWYDTECISEHFDLEEPYIGRYEFTTTDGRYLETYEYEITEQKIKPRDSQ